MLLANAPSTLTFLLLLSPFCYVNNFYSFPSFLYQYMMQLKLCSLYTVHTLKLNNRIAPNYNSANIFTIRRCIFQYNIEEGIIST